MGLKRRYSTTYSNGQQVHCPHCARPLWTECEIVSDGTVHRRLTPTSMAHIEAHEQGGGCTCMYLPEQDAYSPPLGTTCTSHHGYECRWCTKDRHPHACYYTRKQP